MPKVEEVQTEAQKIQTESEIVELLASEWSWEQVLYKIISLENLDPWDVDIARLSSAFLRYILKMKTVDFKIPAKYIIIAAILLRMKSDDLRFWSENDEGFSIEMEESQEPRQRFDIPAIQIPTDRIPKRGIVAEDLIAALRLALSRHGKKAERLARAAAAIQIEQDDITERIKSLYEKIDKLLNQIKDEEIEFSKLLKEWKRSEIVENFLPLLHLDNERKVICRQPKIFDEIYITKVNGVNGHGKKQGSNFNFRNRV